MLALDILDKTEQLIRQCVHNDRLAQRQLYELYAPNMLGVCLRYAKTREEAEEILQEGFLKVFTKINQFNYEGSFEGWVRKIMVNTALEKLRSAKTLHPVISIDTAHHNDATNESLALPGLATKDLLKMIQQLTPMYRMVFNLYAFEGYKHREIAQLLGISEGTSKSNLSDARAILQRAVVNSQTITKLNGR